MHAVVRLAFRPLLVAVAAATFAACATAAPDVKVLGVSEGVARRGSSDKVLVVFVEVVNDTSRDLRLSRLSYRMAADSWFTADGVAPLTRMLTAGTTAVVEVPVPFVGRSAAGAVPYRLDGTLVALDERLERSYAVSASGTIEASAIAVHGTPPRARLRIAGH